MPRKALGTPGAGQLRRMNPNRNIFDLNQYNRYRKDIIGIKHMAEG